MAFPRAQRESDNHLLEGAAPHDVLQRGDCAVDSEAMQAVVVFGAVVVDIAHGRKAELLIIQQLLGDHAAGVAGAGNQDATGHRVANHATRAGREQAVDQKNAYRHARWYYPKRQRRR